MARTVIIVEQGVVSEVVTDHQQEVCVIDRDVKNIPQHQVQEILNGPAYVYDSEVLVEDPNKVEEVFRELQPQAHCHEPPEKKPHTDK